MQHNSSNKEPNMSSHPVDSYILPQIVPNPLHETVLPSFSIILHIPGQYAAAAAVDGAAAVQIARQPFLSLG
jgi:hypothetical protein